MVAEHPALRSERYNLSGETLWHYVANFLFLTSYTSQTYIFCKEMHETVSCVYRHKDITTSKVSMLECWANYSSSKVSASSKGKVGI